MSESNEPIRETSPHLFSEQIETAAEGEAEPSTGLEESIAPEPAEGAPRLSARAPGRKSPRLRGFEIALGPTPSALTGEQRFLILDTWLRSKLPASDFSELIGLSAHTLYAWKRRFEELGPAGLDEKARGGPKGSRLAEPTKRAILMMKQAHPEWGCDRLHHMLMRSEGFFASSGAIARLLREEGYETAEEPTRPHPDHPRSFERARPNQMWQSDLFTFLLRRENRRVYLIAFLDDHSRFIVGYGLHASSSGALVREVFEAAVANFGAPEEVLTDQGPQYHTWRGKSAFTELLERRGVRHIVARAKHPQTLGKVERFWGTLWRECLEKAVFQGLDEARRRIGLFIDHYNFQRPHTGIEGLVPADRFFSAAPDVLKTLKQRVADNAAELARHGVPRKSFYLTGRVGEEGISLHGEGTKVILTKTDGTREEIELTAPGRRAEPGESPQLPEPLAVGAGAEIVLPGVDGETVEPAPGASPLDEGLRRIRDSLMGPEQSGEGEEGGRS